MLKKFFKPKVKINSLNYKEFILTFNESILEFQEPDLLELNQIYVLIRNLKFHPEVKIIEMQQFKNLIKWLTVNLNFILILRDYSLKFTTIVKEFAREKVFLKYKVMLNYLESKKINIAKSIKVTEEIIHVKPYTRRLAKQKLFRLPINRSPLYKSYFSSEELKKLREELAVQNNTRWSNVEILEIYDKFNSKLFADIRQASGSKNLLCYPSFTNADLKPENDMYYLIIGKRRDTGEPVKALSRPAIT